MQYPGECDLYRVQKCKFCFTKELIFVHLKVRKATELAKENPFFADLLIKFTHLYRANSKDMKMIIKQPSLCAIVLLATCAFFADMVSAATVSSNAGCSSIDHQHQLFRDIYNGEFLSSVLTIPERIESGTGKLQAPRNSGHQLDLVTVCASSLRSAEK